MATLLEDLVEWIVASALATGDGTDIFRDYTPDKPDIVMALHEYSGMLSATKGIQTAVRYVQVSSRHTSATAAKTKCNALHALFFTYDENFTTITSGRTILSSPKNTPVVIDRTPDHTTYGFNVAITTTETE